MTERISALEERAAWRGELDPTRESAYIFLWKGRGKSEILEEWVRAYFAGGMNSARQKGEKEMGKREAKIPIALWIAIFTSSVFLPQILSAAHLRGGASIFGSVRDENGEAMPGVFIKAVDAAKGMTVSVLSQTDGKFRLQGLQTGKYDVVAQRSGYKAVGQRGIELGSSPREINFAMARGPINPFNPGLSELQWEKVLPNGKWKQQAIGCGGCHSLSGFTGRHPFDFQGWLAAVNFMKQKELVGVNEEQAHGIAEYLANVFGPDAHLEINLPPEKIDERGLDITFVQYAIPTVNAVAHSAMPDAKGKVWFTEYGGNKIGVVDTPTGKLEEFPVPTPNALPHGIALDKSGNVWFTEHASRAAKIAKLDPNTQKITEYPVPQTVYKGAHEGRPGPHTLLFDSQGMIWFTDTYVDFVRKMNPVTGKITEHAIEGATGNNRANVYGMDRDAQGRVWFTAMDIDKVGYMDPRTEKITMFSMLTKHSGPRRVKVDSQGIAWSGLYYASKLARIDPQSGKVKEYDLPVPRSQPYPVGIDQKGRVWVGTNGDDKLVMFDPATEHFISYSLPLLGNGLRDFFMDAEGWMWCVQMGHNQVLGFKAGS